jgi:putative NIF3 family GTP cyclohydrolase 1 type 2
MLAAHPYEEAAYDVYPLASHPAVTRPELLTGLGRVGRLAAGEVELADYKMMVERALGLPPGGARLLGRGPAAARGVEAFVPSGTRGARRVVRRVAVCPGAGGGYVRQAAAAGADVYVTGDLTYHSAVEACQLGLALIDAGHHGTEKVFTRTMAALLGKGLASEGISLDVSEVPLPSGWLL